MKRFLVILLSVAVLASLAGCSGSKGGDKKWVIVTETYFKPFEYYNDNNEFVGIDVDLLAAIAEDQGFSYELNSLGWDAGVTACKQGQADGIIAAASVTPEREADGWIFSDPYYDAKLVCAVAADSSISSYSDLAGLNVAVKKGTISEEYANTIRDQYGFNIVVFDDSPSTYQDVLYGDSDAVIEDEPIMTASIKDGLELKVVSGMESEPSPYAFAVLNKNNKELVDMFNAGLANIKENGKYQEILDKYLK